MGINFLEPLMLEALDSVMWPFCRIAGFFMAAMAFSGGVYPGNVIAFFARTRIHRYTETGGVNGEKR